MYVLRGAVRSGSLRPGIARRVTVRFCARVEMNKVQVGGCGGLRAEMLGVSAQKVEVCLKRVLELTYCTILHP